MHLFFVVVVFLLFFLRFVCESGPAGVFWPFKNWFLFSPKGLRLRNFGLIVNPFTSLYFLQKRTVWTVGAQRALEETAARLQMRRNSIVIAVNANIVMCTGRCR